MKHSKISIKIILLALIAVMILTACKPAATPLATVRYGGQIYADEYC